jgi:hypothetical protein
MHSLFGFPVNSEDDYDRVTNPIVLQTIAIYYASTFAMENCSTTIASCFDTTLFQKLR